MDETLASLQVRISASSEDAAGKIDNLANALKRLKSAVEGGVGELGAIAQQLEQLSKAAIGAANSASAVDRLATALQKLSEMSVKFPTIPKDLGDRLARLSEAVNRIPPDTAKKLGEMANALRLLEGVNLDKVNRALTELSGKKIKLKIDSSELSRASKRANLLGTVFKSLGRIAFYRVIRSAIKAIGEAFAQGAENAYWYSKTIGDGTKYIAEAYDNIASKSFTMDNQLGAAWATLKAAIAPVLIDIIQLATRAAEAITHLLAALSGRGQYLRAKDTIKEAYENTAKGAAAAKEWRNQLMGFDEINRLEEPSSGGRGGGSAADDYGSMFEEVDVSERLKQFADKLRDLTAGVKLAFKDVFMDWSNLSPEDIAKKVITGLSGLLGLVAGFALGGVPGAIFGFSIMTGVGLLITSLIFDNDGKLSAGEVGEMLAAAATAICGGIIGFIAGGPAGALLGATIGLGVFAFIESLDFMSEGKVSKGMLLDQLTTALAMLGGGIIGFMVGGPLGALLGAIIGLGISAIIESINFEVKNSDRSKYKNGIAWFTVGVLGLPSDEDFKRWGKNVIDWIAEGFRDFGHELYLIFVAPIQNTVDDIKSLLGINSSSTVFKDIGENIVQGLFDGISGKWDSFTSWLEHSWETLKSWWQGLSLGAFDFKTPHLMVDWESIPGDSILARFLGFTSVPHISINWYANGGFPQNGELFLAREAGPELVGTMNGQNAVANNQEITEGIYRAAYQAFTDAMSGGGSDRDVHIYLDGREIANTTTRYQRQFARANG